MLEAPRLRTVSLRAVLALPFLLSACFKISPNVGSETHFLRACSDGCGAGLGCTCGVCTITCTEDASCEAFSSAATCISVDAQGRTCEASVSVERTCAVACARDADCGVLGDGFACYDGSCSERAASAMSAADEQDAGDATPMASIDAGTETSGVVEPACAETRCALEAAPLVLLLVDTSGSMERKSSCTCEDLACTNCLPDCELTERNRWTEILEALTGTFDDFTCTSLERTPQNGATFDNGYYTPHFAPSGAQRPDGVLDRYRDTLRFGLATFDGTVTYSGGAALVPTADFDLLKSLSVKGGWSYNPELAIDPWIRRLDGSRIGSFHYPNCTTDYFVDTGVRGQNALQGALLTAHAPLDGELRADDVGVVNDEMQASLLRVRPYAGTPIAASLDDLYFYFAKDPELAKERQRARRPSIVLITDGEPDKDFRNFDCDCNDHPDQSDPLRCGPPPNDPAVMRCPYPTTEQAARTLRCGEPTTCSDGPIERIYVIGYSTEDPDIVESLDAIADAGGTDRARFAGGDAEALRNELSAILDEIARP